VWLQPPQDALAVGRSLDCAAEVGSSRFEVGRTKPSKAVYTGEGRALGNVQGNGRTIAAETDYVNTATSFMGSLEEECLFDLYDNLELPINSKGRVHYSMLKLP
jgi:hypothetical protein